MVCLVTNPDDIMEVCSVFGQRLVECTWIGKEGKVYKHSFRPESLKLVTEEDSIELPSSDTFLKINDDDDDSSFSF